ncbi:putative metal-dependent peptidase [Streptomyces sp. Ag109_G2-6]|uniref:vWA domain-containing protein n=1 Tax=Streptomyces TaxID=1883 RepID=UPI0009A4F934|nr:MULTISPECIES: VWA-like domain-containing protein [Streptomyces]RPF30107.1 putative metal-dependent peptidase [Streptomyces sp. Ag109_G2-6]
MAPPPPPRPVRAAVPGEPPGPAVPLDTEKLLAARLHAASVRPYLAGALFALHVVEDRSVPTMAVDAHWRCYVSPSFVARTPLEQLAGVWVHEVSHLLRDHHERGERYAREHGESGPGQRLRQNIAADFEINDDIFGDGLPMPAGAVRPAMMGLPEGLLMEEYLRRFPMADRTPQMAWLDCGSGADGWARPWELGPEGAHGLSRQQRDAVRFRVAEAITGRPGDAPEGWRRWADEAFHPPQPWRQLLGAAVRAAAGGPGAGEDHSYRRPSRRSAGVPGVVLPSLRRTPPRVCVVIDTSGSVSDAELGTALLEVAAISRAVGGRRDLVSVISCDAAAGVAVPLCRAENLELIGGGGTDLRSGFARALRCRPRPDVIVALTDGQTPWPSAQPSCRTVVGLFPRLGRPTDENDQDYVPEGPPPWARVVHLG